MPMNMPCWTSSRMCRSGIARKPLISDEYVSQSRLTAWTSSCVVTDQKPLSSGKPVMPDDQCTGHFARMRSNWSSGGPSVQCSWSAIRRCSNGTSLVCAGISDVLMRASSTSSTNRIGRA
jgi:hypothetical protein